MDKRTIIAIVLSVVIIIAAFAIQALFFPPKPPDGSAQIPSSQVDGAVGETEEEAQRDVKKISPLLGEEREVVARNIPFSTNIFEGSFSTMGGNMTSIKLKNYTEGENAQVEMIISGESGRYPFNIILDEYDTGNDMFSYKKSLLGNEYEFTRLYVYTKNGKEIPFTLKKMFLFKDNEYLIEYRVSIESENREDLPLESYSLTFGPQIGPRFAKLDQRAEFRKYIYYADGKRKDYTKKVKKDRKEIEARSSWHAIEGKYFLAIGISYISDLSSFSSGFDATPIEGLPTADRSSLYFDRSIGKNYTMEDGFKFYIGPKKKDILIRYSDREQNEFNESGLNLEYAVPSDFWGWLSSALKWVLELFYKLIPNWGVAIILLTIFIKILFFPLTRKSFESNKKMQALGPKLEELKKKYEGKSQKLNQEMAALYKREHVSPLGGCLPLLLQMPIFFAMYGLFNNYFELRGAAFITPWIADLSAPETVFTLPFSIPFLGAEFRILPFLMLATTFIQQKISQAPGQSSNKNTKLMMYAMPAFFFFIMYNMPSGLLLYWTMQNFFTFITQYYINHHKGKGKKSRGAGDKK